MMNWFQNHWKRTIFIVVLLCVIFAPTWSGKVVSKLICFIGHQIDSFSRSSLGDQEVEGVYDFFNFETTNEKNISGDEMLP